MSYLSQREAFGRALAEYGHQNEKIVVLDADTSSSTLSKYFADEFPDRFVNVGIAEPCLVDVAVGLSLGGFIPFVNAFAALLSLRAVEQIRTCVAYANTNVKIIAGYAGLSDFKDGPTHHSIVDIGIMRMLPNMTVIVPADEIEITKWVSIIAEHKGPVYMRLSREGSEIIHSQSAEFRIGKGIVIVDGSDLAVISVGSMLQRSLKAVERLQKQGISAALIELPCIKPIDVEMIIHFAHKTGAMVTVEEHSVYGGLGGAVAEVVSLMNPIPLIRVGVQDEFTRTALNHDSLLNYFGMGVEDVIKAAKKVIALKKDKTLN